ncbi:MAG: glycosyltransferase [Pseudomonadota bacterium]
MTTDAPAPGVIDDEPAFDCRHYIDRYNTGDVAGWATDTGAPDAPVSVQFLVRGALVGAAQANIARHDVANAGHAPVHCGFHWRIPPAVASAVLREATPIAVRAINRAGLSVPLGELHLSADPAISDAARALLRPVLDRAVVSAAVEAIEKGTEPIHRHEPARYPLHEAMFAFEGAKTGDVARALSPYLSFTHRRLNKQNTHALDGSEATKNAYLRWYLEDYGRARLPRRTPLGADEIAYLNAPDPLVGLPYKVSRASLSFAATEKDGADLFPLNTVARYEAFVAWWCTKKVVDLHLEDCLVPDYYIEVMRRMTIDWMGSDFAFSQAMRLTFKEMSAENAFDVRVESDRILFFVWYILNAVDEPGRLRFIPLRSFNALFEGEKGKTLFDRIIQSVHTMGAGLGEVFTAESLSDVLWRKGFDLRRRRFIFQDIQGNRFEAARRPPATTQAAERIDLQVIGPFEKSSGLGQASRLSGDTLRQAGIAANFVDFGLDNPAPIGMTASRLAYQPPVPARVNLIHLNGETVPIALAYMEDVFNGAYNIGYFFWELSTPSAAQKLALGLLDEIWVATDYGVSIYEPVVDIPVRNVGMAVEPMETPDKAAARAWVRERLPIGPETFVCLAAFDSFSFLERKNPHGMVDAFRTAFGPEEDVALVLKTHNRDFVLDTHQSMRWERILEIANTDPRIIIMNETLRYPDLIKLKAGADCFVSLHRSEGWGFGLIEAMSVGTPVVATGYSGSLDFAREESAFLVDYDLVEPGANEYIFVDKGQVWAAPKLESAVNALRTVRADPRARAAKVARAKRVVAEEYSLKAQAKKYKTRLDQIFAGLNAKT